MPSGEPTVPDDAAPEDDGSRWQRLTGRLSLMMLKPTVAAETATGEDRPQKVQPTTVEELEEAVKRTDDKERVIGLIAAPIAAAIVFLVTSALVHNDPAATINGVVNPHHTNPTDYTELGLLTLVLALVMLGGAWYRKRLVIGIASALYGLSFFNLHYWGFGVPYIMIGSWYMVRAYRLSQKLKLARGEDATPNLGPTRSPSTPNKRYTPPTTTPVRTPKPKPGKELGAG
jgi:hypothetical protein